MKHLLVSSLLHLLLLVAVAQCGGNAKDGNAKLAGAVPATRSMRQADEGQTSERTESSFQPKPPTSANPSPPWNNDDGHHGGGNKPSRPWNGGGQWGWYPPNPPWHGGGQGGWYPPNPPWNGGGQGGWYPPNPPWNGGGYPWNPCNPPDPKCPRCKNLKTNSPKNCRDFCINNNFCFCWPWA